MRTTVDVAIAGAGPAGLATAIACARRGLSVIVLEKSSGVVDKACGEGIMPAGVAALDRLGLGSLRQSGKPITGLCYVQEDGARAEAPLPAPGLGLRRQTLAQAMMDAARQAGAEIIPGCEVIGRTLAQGSIIVHSIDSQVRASVLVAADGLGSRLRRLERIEIPSRGPRRFGVRKHIRIEPWTSSVEIHFARGVEAYVTPVRDHCVGIACLFDPETLRHPEGKGAWERLLMHFPSLAERLEGHEDDSVLRGAGPFLHRTRTRVHDRVVFVGDAGGYVDPITGEGISLALTSALDLARILPDAIARGASAEDLAPYERAYRQHFRSYARTAGIVLGIARRPRMRTRLIHWFGTHPDIFRAVVRRSVLSGVSPA